MNYAASATIVGAGLIIAAAYQLQAIASGNELCRSFGSTGIVIVFEGSFALGQQHISRCSQQGSRSTSPYDYFYDYCRPEVCQGKGKLKNVWLYVWAFLSFDSCCQFKQILSSQHSIEIFPNYLLKMQHLLLFVWFAACIFICMIGFLLSLSQCDILTFCHLH